jgi:hypothetical protein
MNSPDNHMTGKMAFGWILLASLLAHGLLPFCTTVISDDWFTLLSYREASLTAAWRGAMFLSMPLTVLQALPFFLIGDNLFVLRSINFLMIVTLGQLIFLLLARLRPEALRDALWIALFAVVFPGYLVHFMVSFIFYQLGLILFIGALLLVLVAEDEQRTNLRRLFFALAGGMVFYSFHFGALLVFYGFFIVAHFSHRWRQRQLGFGAEVVDYLAKRYLFLLLPFWFWGMRQVFGLLMPTWASYNSPSLAWPAIREGLLGFASSYQLIVGDLFSIWLAGALVVLVLIALVRSKTAAPLQSDWHDWLGVGLGFAILAAGILPFVLVGKYPLVGPINARDLTPFNLANIQILSLIDTRMHLFLGLAVGVVLVHLSRIVTARLHLRSNLRTAILGAILISSATVCVRFYLRLEKSAVVMAGVREHMKANPELKAAGVIGVVDRLGNVSTTWDSWVLFLETVWGDRAHHGVPEKWFGRQLNYKLVYNGSSVVNKQLYGGAWYGYFDQPTPGGKQATVILSPGESYFRKSDAEAFGLYYYYRLFAPHMLPGYVKRFAEVTVLPKMNLLEELREGRIGNSWRELQPVGKLAGDIAESYLTAGQSTADQQVVENKRRSRPYQSLSQAEGGGSYVLFELDIDPNDSDALASVRITDFNGRTLSSMVVRRPGGLAIMGWIDKRGDLLRLNLGGEDDAGRATWVLRRVRQQPVEEAGLFCLLPQPYLTPNEIDSAHFQGLLDIEQVHMTALLWLDGPPPRKLPYVQRQTGLHFHPENPAQTVSTDSIEVRADHQVYVRVDWGEFSPSGNMAVVQAMSDDGHRLMRFFPPRSGGVRYYLLPIQKDTRRVWLRIGSDGEKPAGLPRRLSMVEADPLLSLGVAIENLFPMTVLKVEMKP